MEKKYLIWDDGNGNAVIIEDGYMRKLYLRMAKPYYNGGEAIKFFEVKTTGGAFTSSNGKVKVNCGFDNPHNPTILSDEKVYQHDGRVYRDGDSLCLAMDNTDPIIFHGYREIEYPEELIIPLPKVRVKNYLMRNGLTFIYVSYDKYMMDYDTHKFFIGPPSDMREVEIEDLIRYRDGGTTIIKTKVGELFVPTPFKKGTKDYIIRFNDEEFLECPEEMKVEEDGSIARVTNLT